MTNLTYDELLRRAKACDQCGKEHRYRLVSQPEAITPQYSWADPDDGHDYDRHSSEFGRVAKWLERQPAEGVSGDRP